MRIFEIWIVPVSKSCISLSKSSLACVLVLVVLVVVVVVVVEIVYLQAPQLLT